MPGDLAVPQLIVLAILVVAFGLLVTERLRNDVVAVLIILALAATHVLDPPEALAGFGSEPAIVVAAIFVLSYGLEATGLSERIGVWIGRLAGASYNRALVVIMVAVALLSAFTHHLTTTAIMLPVTLDLCRERDIAPSKLLMPLSFAASLGTTITIIGAPAFLIASGVLQEFGRPGLGIFSIAPIGLALSVAGTLFMLLVGRLLLPDRTGGESSANRFRLDNYFTELKVLAGSPLQDKTLDEVHADTRYELEVAGWRRNGRRVRGSLGAERVREGDVLLVRTTPDQMVAFREESGVELHPIDQYGAEVPSSNGNAEDDLTERLVQAVVAPGSHLVGRTLAEVDFRRRYGAIVLGLWRQDALLEGELAQIRLRAGDVLVLQGDEAELDRVANDRAFLMLVPFQGETRLRQRAPWAGAIMLATVVVAAAGWLSIEIAALAGAAALVLTRCITAHQAYHAIDARIYVFIAGAIPLGTAMKKTGTSELIASWLQGLVGGWSEVFILLAIFAVVGILTQFMSDAATTALFAPVAAALALSLGHSPEAYVVTVAMAAVASFLTPIGHHGNLLVYGPGRYHFADFARVGTPLTILTGLIVVLIASFLWRG